MGLKVEVPVVDCYGREVTGCKIELSRCNVSLIHFKFTNQAGEETDKYLKTEDLKAILKVF